MYDDTRPSASPTDRTLVRGEASPMDGIAHTVRRVGPRHVTILLTGETGTGKEVVARKLHEAMIDAGEADGAFVPVNVAAIPEALLESELFGHIKGAFTGAHHNRRGRVALAEGGTLFLDEVGELPPSAQVKLLRLLQERTYEAVGDCKSVEANFRLIAATHRDLAAEVEAGRFREDLYYRLFVCPIELPALRDRPMDVGPLLRHFWNRLGETRPFTQKAEQALSTYPWPGNVRELENLVERLSVCAETAVISFEQLPARYAIDNDAPDDVAAALPSPAPDDGALVESLTRDDPEVSCEGAVVAEDEEDSSHDLPSPSPDFPLDLPSFLRSVEWRMIEAALDSVDGNRQAAARLLGLGRTTLVEKIKRHKDSSAEGAPLSL